MAKQGDYITEGRLWLTGDGARLVPEGDPDAAVLFARKGTALSPEVVKRYNLAPAGAKQEPPAANKEAPRAANKGAR